MIRKILFSGLVMTSMIMAKTVPSAFVGHKDVPDSSFGDSTLSLKILIVSRDSEYKRDLAYTAADSLSKKSAFVEVSGVKKLKKLNAQKYTAIIIINTCLSWQIDNKVQRFFKKNPDYLNIVLLTTSADPEGCGKGRHIPEYVDAISAASTRETMATKVEEVLGKVKVFLP